MKARPIFIKSNIVGPRGRILERTVPAAIISRITRRTLSGVAWWRSVLEAHGQEDADWNWQAIVKDCRLAARAGKGCFEFITLRAKRDTQSVMILETEAHLSHRTGDSIVYVEYLTVAPWNRQPIQAPRHFSGCGSALIEFAIRRSEELGHDGRVGLHSLPGSRTFYERSGFIDLGADEAEGGLHYYEYPA